MSNKGKALSHPSYHWGATALMLVALFFLFAGCAKEPQNEPDLPAQPLPAAKSALLLNFASAQGGTHPFLQLPQYTWVLIQGGGEGITLKVGDNQLLLRGMDGWYQGENITFAADAALEEPYAGYEESSYLRYQYRTDTLALGIYPLGKRELLNPLPAESLQEEAAKEDWPYQWNSQRLLYAGDGMLLLLEEHFETGGGTYNAGWYRLVLRSLNLNYPGHELPLARFENPQAIEEIYRLQKQHDKVLQQQRDEYNEIFIGSRQYIVPEEALPVYLDGGWHLGYVLANEFIHNGNGSYFRTMAEVIPTKFLLPERIEPRGIVREETIENIAGTAEYFVSKDHQLAVVFRDNSFAAFRLAPEGYLPQGEVRLPDGSVLVAGYELSPQEVAELLDQL